MTAKLNQVLAIEKGVKSKAHSVLTQIHHRLQKPGLLMGQARTYAPLDEEGMTFPPESQRVQLRVSDAFQDARSALRELFDVTAQKDFANCSARADVVVDGKTVVAQAPVTFLLFLEKQLTDVRTLITKTPTLDSDVEWSYDDNKGLYRSEATETTKTKKVQKPVVLYPATPEHPAQTQLVTEDVVIGKWTTVRHSGALPMDQKAQMLLRVNKLLDAVKFARESANSAEAPRQSVGDSVLGFVFGD